jgi:hypothetical protein
MVESVCQSLDFFLALSQFAIELITISLELLFLLSSFNDEVCLRVFSGGILLT